MTTKRVLSVAAAVLVLALSAAKADKKDKEDENTRSVQGTVLDAAENPVSGAVVQLKDTKTLQVRSFITLQKGEFHFSGLSTNIDYELKAQHNGMSSATRTLSVFDTRRQAHVVLKLDRK